MRLPRTTTLLILVCALSACGDDNWPQFRGLGGLGIGSGDPPTHWNIETGENIAWKTPIPGLGHSAPIVWGDRVFLTTAVSSDSKDPEVRTGWSGGTGESADEVGEWTWRLICLNKKTGEVLWSRNAHVGEPTIKRHLKSTHANCSPVTNGERVVAFFGSEGLFCYDFDGKQLWRRNFGKLHSGPYDAPELEWGFASSPIIHKGVVILQCDCLNTNFVALVDLKTGKEIRRIDRRGEVATWSTPLAVSAKGREQIVCNGFRHMAGYEFSTGKELWRLSGGGDVPVPTPLYSSGLIYMTNGHGRSPVFAIRPDAVGDLTHGDDSKLPDGIAWTQLQGGSYMPTPLVKGKRLYVCGDNGRLTVSNALSGETFYRQRVGDRGGTYSASAVAAGGHVYFVSESGAATVVAEGETYEQVATNELGEPVLATPAISGDRLLIRTVRHLVCIAPSDL